MGEGGYKGLYSLVSIVGVVLIAWGFARYRATGWIDVWYPPAWTRHVAVALILAAIDLLRRGLFARPHQDHAQASDAGRDRSCGRSRI